MVVRFFLLTALVNVLHCAGQGNLLLGRQQPAVANTGRRSDSRWNGVWGQSNRGTTGVGRQSLPPQPQQQTVRPIRGGGMSSNAGRNYQLPVNNGMSTGARTPFNGASFNPGRMATGGSMGSSMTYPGASTNSQYKQPQPARLGNDDSCTLGRCKDERNCPNPSTEDSSLFNKVCINDGTETPWTGELLQNKNTGTYSCSCCGQALFSSANKYDSKTGWPSFYQPINEHAVTYKEDYHMGYKRIEVMCSKCGAHLGHVFEDGPAPTGKRYCINSVCMQFEPGTNQDFPFAFYEEAMFASPAVEQPKPFSNLATLDEPSAELESAGSSLRDFLSLFTQLQNQLEQQGGTSTARLPSPGMSKAIIAGGCFWGIELVYEYVKGVSSARSGYAGGRADTANYKAVTTGKTGHAEAVEIIFDPKIISYADILRIFFAMHDPTTLNYQKPDRGPHYRSAIYYMDETQKREAESVIREAQRKFSDDIVTEVTAYTGFYLAEKEHQDFGLRKPDNAYIITWDLPKLVKLQKEFPQFYDYQEEPLF